MPKYKVKITYDFIMESEEYPDRDIIEKYILALHKENKWDVSKFELSYVINSDGSKSYDNE